MNMRDPNLACLAFIHLIECSVSEPTMQCYSLSPDRFMSRKMNILFLPTYERYESVMNPLKYA